MSLIIWEEKLHDPDRAAGEFEAGWPESSQAAEWRETPVLVGLDQQGNAVATQVLPIEKASNLDDLVFPLPLLERSGQLYVGLGNSLVILRSEHAMRSFDFPLVVRGLSGTVRNTVTRIAVALEVGAYVVWDHAGRHEIHPFAKDMREPVVGFNRGGYAIAASTDGIVICNTKGAKVELVAEADLLTSAPVSVLSAPRTDRFAVLTEEGALSVFEI